MAVLCYTAYSFKREQARKGLSFPPSAPRASVGGGKGGRETCLGCFKERKRRAREEPFPGTGRLPDDGAAGRQAGSLGVTGGKVSLGPGGPQGEVRTHKDPELLD